MPSRRALISALLASLALPGAALANPTQLSMMMDDDRLLYRSAKTADQTLDTMASLGVDYVRVTVLWSVVAERARNTKRKDRRFRKLGADNPKAYPKGNWDRYDHLVRSAGARGLKVYFNVTGPGPEWCCEKPPRGEEENVQTWMPKSREFKNFVKAVGTRYSGKYRDENVRGKLPRVSFWSLWNEPNQGGWLTPQYWKGKPYSPSLYRELFFKGREGLVATGHARDIILVGETAPIGLDENRSRAPMDPTTFISELFCVDRLGNRTSGRGCDAFTRYGPIVATAYAHHPYSKDRSPYDRDKDPDAITMANLDDLTGLLDRVAEKTGRVAEGLPIALTEFGYESSPPDRFYGIPIADQADYTVFGELIAWANPRVISQTQFLLRDVKPIAGRPLSSKSAWRTYQSGLYYNNGKPKPSAAAYRFPFLVSPIARGEDGRLVYVLWGQARFRPNSVADTLYVQHRAAGTKSWVTIGEPIRTGALNYFSANVTSPGPGRLRVVWVGTQPPAAVSSRTQRVG